MENTLAVSDLNKLNISSLSEPLIYGKALLPIRMGYILRVHVTHTSILYTHHGTLEGAFVINTLPVGMGLTEITLILIA